MDWRRKWDQDEDGENLRHGYDAEEDSLRQLRRLLLFYNPKEDVKRLLWYGQRQITTTDKLPCQGGQWSKAYHGLEKACISALRIRRQADYDADRELLSVLSFATSRTLMRQTDAIEYYGVLTALRDAPPEQLQTALLAPLTSSVEAYAGLAALLTKPQDQSMLENLRSAIDSTELARSLVSMNERSYGSTPQQRLWLLGNTIYLAGQSRSEALTTIVARLLGSLADDVEFENSPIDLDNITFSRDVLSKISTGLPLNTFLYTYISSLIKDDSIRNLLARDPSKSADVADNTRLLAGYALTLLRCFPRHADDIRMGIHLGPKSSTTPRVPAARYFWDAAKTSSVFGTIWQNSRKVIPLIKTSPPTTEMREGWTVIWMFLELYTFLLKVMDDEAFVGTGRKPSAIPLAEVGDLVTFLKNLGFTLYFNSSELNNNADGTARDSSNFSLGRHFGGMSSLASEPIKNEVEARPIVVAELPGLTVDYLKGLVTGLLRAIYERDSRRNFLSKGHWLMTSRFDMTSFIPGVVAEEESRHLVQEQDDEDKDLDSEDDMLEPQTPRQRGYTNALRSQEARARAQRKASRKRYLESVAPRLEILQNMPFFIPFTTRVEIFRQFVQLDQEKRRNGTTDPDLWRQNMMFNPPNGMPPRELLARHHAKIRRKNEFGDAFEQFYELGADLKEPIQITFVDEWDIPEAGIDGGGVTKEFLTSVISQAFDTNNSDQFFVENDKHLLYPNPTAVEDLRLKWREMGFEEHHVAVRQAVRDLLQRYEFLGRIIGKCLYEGILVDVSFAGFFLKKWALTGGPNSAAGESSYRANINDLRELDESLYKGLLSLKDTPADDVESLGLTFTVDDVVGPEGHQRVIERELVPGGANMAVTAQNALVYITQMSRYRLQGQSSAQTGAFLRGLSSIVQPSWLSMFNQTELQTLIGGAAAGIDVQDLRRNTLYGGTYVIGDDGQEHPSIRLFWDVMASMEDADRRALLKFVTSTPRGPLLGFGSLNPRFSIRDSGRDEQRLPTASTCVNLLKLPMYKSEKVLREKLLTVVRLGAGFDLS